MHTTASISIVIPLFNDRNELESTIAKLLSEWRGDQIVISDGGSTDGGPEWARSKGLAVVRSERPQRARQLNIGAVATSGELLFFLHADTIPPMGAAALIAMAVNAGAVGGAFERRFASNSILLRATCALATLRGRLFGSFLGDQGMFVRRDTFTSLGGFPEWNRLEDAGFSRLMRRAGKVVLLNPPVVSSARRFDRKGPLLQTLVDSFSLLGFVFSHPKEEVRKDSESRASKKESSR